MFAGRAFFLVVLLVFFAACGSETSDPGTGTSESADAADVSGADGAAGAGNSAGAGDARQQDATDSLPEMTIEDEVVGDGPEVESGDTIVAHYTLWRYDESAEGGRGEQLQSSHDFGRTFETRIGVGAVIPGWDQGLLGMKPGGVRHLTIPPHLAYAEHGFPPQIGPGETLVFKIEVLEVKKSSS